MPVTFMFKQIADLNQELKTLTYDIQTTISKNEKLTAEYKEGSEEYKKNKLSLERQVDTLEYKLHQLDLAIEEIERKLAAEKDEYYRLDMEVRTGNLELKEIKAETAKDKNNFELTIKKLNNNIQNEGKKLKQEKQLGVEEDEKFKADMQRLKDNLEEKLKSMRKSKAESNDRLEKRFKAKEDPLLNKVKYLDETIEDLEKEIAIKTKELRELKARYEVLRKKIRVGLCDVNGL